MHSYINTDILRQFDKSITESDIIKDLTINYDIQNIYRDCDGDLEYVIYLADALKEDIDMERANYKAYIEKGMNARILMELRKTAILPIAESDYLFYKEHCKCETVDDIKNKRIQYLKQKNSDYDDADWQYYAVCRWYLRRKSVDIYFNMEYCYADANMLNYKSVEDARLEFLEHVGFKP